MPLPFNVIGIFCEDIREEKTGQNTIIGILPDNVKIGTVPSAMPKLGFYARATLDRDTKPSPVSLKIVHPDGSEMGLPSWDQAVIDKAFDESTKEGAPLIGLVLRAVMTPFPVKTRGRVRVLMTSEGVEYTIATLNFTV